VETSEIGTDDKEHAEWLFGVLDLWEERGIQSERECDLCGISATPHKHRSQHARLTSGLVEVALEDVLVEDEQGLQDLEGVLVGGFLSDLEVQILVRQGLFGLQPLERESRSELRGLVRSRV
jgi:hypothetical protein